MAFADAITNLVQSLLETDPQLRAAIRQFVKEELAYVLRWEPECKELLSAAIVEAVVIHVPRKVSEVLREEMQEAAEDATSEAVGKMTPGNTFLDTVVETVVAKMTAEIEEREE